MKEGREGRRERGRKEEEEAEWSTLRRRRLSIAGSEAHRAQAAGDGRRDGGRTDKQVRERERGTEEPNRSCIGLDEQQRITWVSLTTF